MKEVNEPKEHSRLAALLTISLATILSIAIPGLVGRSLALILNALDFKETLRTRATIAISGAMFSELVVLLLLIGYLRSRRRSLQDLGLWQPAPFRGWVVATVFTALYLWLTFTGVLRGHAALGEVSLFHIYNSLLAGVVAGSVEEIFFRGFVMSELRCAGFGATVQILVSGVLFGAAHFGWVLFSGRVNWQALIGPVTATAILGLAYAISYIASRRSLMPVIAGHFIMNVLIEPWLILAALSGAMFQPH